MKPNKLLFPVVIVCCLGVFVMAVQGYVLSLKKKVRDIDASARERMDGMLRSTAEAQAARAASESARRELQSLLQREQETVSALQERVKRISSAHGKLERKVRKSREAAVSGASVSRQDLERAVNERDAVARELDTLKRKYDVVAAVKLKLDDVEASLAGAHSKRGKDTQFKTQLAGIRGQLDSIAEYLMALRDNEPLPEIQAPAEVVHKPLRDVSAELSYRQEIDSLKAQLEMASRDSSVLREKFKLAQDALAQYKQDLASRDEKVFSLQSKLVETENSLADIRTKYIDLERSSASLRERFVATELEKEGLRVRLANTSEELSDLRKKFVALLNKISSVFKTADELPSQAGDPGKGTVNVELIPQEGRKDAQIAP